MVAVFKPGEIRFQDAQHGGRVGGVALTGIIAPRARARAELDDAEGAEVNLAPRGGRWPGRC